MRNIALIVVVCFIGAGIGFSVWLGFFRDAHYYSRSLSQEKRGAEWVGQNPVTPPVKPINFQIHNSGCLRVNRVRVDGDTLMVDVTRICGADGDYAELHWRALAGDTVIESGYDNWRVDGVGLGENEIVTMDSTDHWQADTRITDIIVSTRAH